MKNLPVCALLLILAACGKEQPAAPSAEQSDQLNDADAMLNDVAANEEGPEANTSSPSGSSS